MTSSELSAAHVSLAGSSSCSETPLEKVVQTQFLYSGDTAAAAAKLPTTGDGGATGAGRACPRGRLGSTGGGVPGEVEGGLEAQEWPWAEPFWLEA